MNDIAKNIRKLRQKRNMTQEELAEKLFVTRQAVSNWETGKNQPDIELLKSLADVFEVEVTELLYGAKPDPNKGRRLLTAKILGGMAAAAWILFAFLYDTARFRQSRYFDTRLSYVLIYFLRPLAFFLLGAAVAALVSVWKDLRPHTVWARRGMLILGGGFVLLYVLALLSLGIFHALGLHYHMTVWVGYNSWSFLIPGGCLFCAWHRKAG